MTSSTINLIIKKLLQVLHYYTLVLNSLEILILILSDTAVIKTCLSWLETRITLFLVVIAP
mgnify:CR=1